MLGFREAFPGFCRVCGKRRLLPRHGRACRRARGLQGQALRVAAEWRPSLTSARHGGGIVTWSGRKNGFAEVEPKNSSIRRSLATIRAAGPVFEVVLRTAARHRETRSAGGACPCLRASSWMCVPWTARITVRISSMNSKIASAVSGDQYVGMPNAIVGGRLRLGVGSAQSGQAGRVVLRR
jgi:hypothetical protein